MVGHRFHPVKPIMTKLIPSVRQCLDQIAAMMSAIGNVSNRGDLNQPVRTNEIGANAIPRRRFSWKIRLVDFIHRLVVGEVLEKYVIESDVGERTAARFNNSLDRIKNTFRLRADVSRSYRLPFTVDWPAS